MANPEHLAILKQGVNAWNRWREEDFERLRALSKAALSKADLAEANLAEANFSGANLSGANLSGADLYLATISEADLTGANLSHAKLMRAFLSGANLSEADLSNAHLNGAELFGADLTGADLVEADLVGADLYCAKLARANVARATLVAANLNRTELDQTDLSECRLSSTVFADVDLSSAKGLETVHHLGPSTIGLDTFFKSQGRIPEVFLRGCGVPDIFLEYAASLVGKPIEFYSLFISYSSYDQALAERLHADLQAKGVRCWFAPEDLKIGDRFRAEIDRAIRLHDKLLLLLSAASVASDWVEKEVETAFERERQDKRTILFPIRLDDAVMAAEEGWAADLRRTRHIGDFRRWKDPDAYEKAFDRLLRDLKGAVRVAAT